MFLPVRMRAQLLFWAAYLLAYRHTTSPTKENDRAELPQ